MISLRKLIIFFVPGIFISFLLSGQQTTSTGQLLYQDSLLLDPLHGLISIPNADNNIWKLGVPGNDYIDSTLSKKIAIYIDTPLLKMDYDDHFFINLPAADSLWGEGILSFYHNYCTDSLISGGIIEVSYDLGQTWLNIIDDKNHIESNFIGIYGRNDTLPGNIPAFTGQSGTWVYTELYWWWGALTKKGARENYGTPIVKFSFINNSEEGEFNTWVIDEIVFRGYSISGDVNDPSFSGVAIGPNPVINELQISVPQNVDNYKVEIINLSGLKVFQNEYSHSTSLDMSKLKPGIYFCILRKDSKVFAARKFIKK